MVLGRFRVKGKKGTICREGVETSTPEVCVIKSKTVVTAVEEAFNNALECRLDGARGVYDVDAVHPGALHAVMDETTAELMKLDDDVDMTTVKMINKINPHRAVVGETYHVRVRYTKCEGGSSLITETESTITDASGFELCAAWVRMARLTAFAKTKKVARTDNYHYIWTI